MYICPTDELLDRCPSPDEDLIAPPVQPGRTMTPAQRRELALRLLGAAERGHGQDAARANNQLARQIMGWHIRPDDPLRLWRGVDGSPVSWHCRDGRMRALCAYPWIPGTNDEMQAAFSPWPNYHTRRIEDWEQVVLEKCEQEQGVHG